MLSACKNWIVFCSRIAGCVTIAVSYWKPYQPGQQWRVGKRSAMRYYLVVEHTLHWAAAGENISQHTLVAQPPVQGPIEEIYMYLEEVITHMGKMKKNKACGPDCLPIEVAKALGDEGAIWMTGVLNEAMRKGIPEKWRTSTITPIYKQKGDPWNVTTSEVLNFWATHWSCGRE